VDFFCPSSPSFSKRGLGEILIPLSSPFEKGRNYFKVPLLSPFAKGGNYILLPPFLKEGWGGFFQSKKRIH